MDVRGELILANSRKAGGVPSNPSHAGLPPSIRKDPIPRLDYRIQERVLPTSKVLQDGDELGNERATDRERVVRAEAVRDVDDEDDTQGDILDFFSLHCKNIGVRTWFFWGGKRGG